ncbi:NAD-dependent epimerase/dehydratase family protein [Kutzneria sp. CA-103260]|uniref:NAD-dependent epimerase/dehydratase family protein n=1 Tax=Kutzneria sp. CA-103260 TaxID=2802641 RepID=UPI001BA654C6|nr:NAD-dependent epimerase/dehydratase family protein [Kutzneria sp. CA-103260]QUQ71990.1 nucleotide-diphosphate-sugar epimerase/NmrA family protein [Kutzneria sp. CA-103260]
MTILVTGATGTTGSRVAAKLRARGADVRAVSRSTAVPFDWHDAGTYGPVVAGVDRVYLVAPVGVADPSPQFDRFLADAVAAGVRRVVLLSSDVTPESTPGLDLIRHAVRRMPEWAVLRPSWFMQNVVNEHWLAVGIRERQEMITATGDARLGFVDADDIAAVAVELLLTDEPVADDYVLTGPEALSYADLAALLTESGRPARHVPVTVDQYVAHLTAQGVPPEFATGLGEVELQVRGGFEDRVTDTVERVTGRPPRSYREFLACRQD